MNPSRATDLLPFTLSDLTFYFLKLGTTGFGGPIALVGYMERNLVEERQWFSREQYLRGLALAQLAPGPLAAQLAIYLGYVRGKTIGATLVGIAFILPSFLMVVVLGALYVSYGGLAWMQSVFYGVGAGVIGIIIKSAYKLTKMTLKRDRLLWTIFTIMLVTTAFTEQEIAWLFLASGFIAVWWYSARNKPRSLKSVLPLGLMVLGLPDIVPPPSLTTIFLFFARAGAFIFGSGLAIVPFLLGGVVQQYQWLNERQFLDAVAVAMITPGPVVITVGFIGYLVAGLSGAIAAALGVFLPVYLFVVLPAPYVERFAQNPYLRAFVNGVTAAATGAIAGAVIVLGRRAIIDIPTAAIAIATLLLLSRFKVSEPILVTAAGLAGLALAPVH
jgi:chromate transporter